MSNAPASKPITSTGPRVVGVCDIINNKLLSGIERLAEWLVRREDRASWEDRINLEIAWPAELPLLVGAALETLHDDVIGMVGDRAAFLQACDRCQSERRISRMGLEQYSRTQLVAVAQSEAGISRWSRLTKEHLIDAILDARHPKPVCANMELELLWQDELAEGRERIRVRRVMVLMSVGSTETVDEFAVRKMSEGEFDVDGTMLNIEEAVRHVRTMQPLSRAA
ncbi:hypothetical protein EKK58_05865 [Candidatus Dependentiae bacterium]|nr:MAG: hypothetical protein EKK58_05865 [Candidatus Dependentiae bacterium]